MPTKVVSIKLDTRKIDQLRGQLGYRAGQVLDKMAMDGERAVKDEIVRLHVIDTGALLDSINWKPEGRWVRVVRDGVEYGIYQHEGYHMRNGNYWPGRPFFRIAFERLRPIFKQAWGALFK